MRRWAVLSLLALSLMACGRQTVESFRLDGLQVEYMETPLGIDVAEPRFSWQMSSEQYDQRQTAFRIEVKEAAKGRTVWTSDVRKSNVSVGVVYGGEALKPATRYDWTVTVWNAAQDSCEWLCCRVLHSRVQSAAAQCLY